MYNLSPANPSTAWASNTGSPDYGHLPEDSGRSALFPQPAGAVPTVFKATEALRQPLKGKSRSCRTPHDHGFLLWCEAVFNFTKDFV